MRFDKFKMTNLFVAFCRKTGKIVLDIFLISSAYYLAFLLRFDGNVPATYVTNMRVTIPYIAVIFFGLLYLSGVYRGIWRYASVRDLVMISISDFAGLLICYMLFTGFMKIYIPRSVFLIFGNLVLILIAGVRFLYRIIKIYWPALKHASKRILIIGAGNAGEMVVRQSFKEPKLGYRPIGFIDDKKGLKHDRIHGIPILGTIEVLNDIVKKKRIDEVIIATPSATPNQMRRIVKYCEKAGVKFKTLPGMKELINGQFTLQKIRKVNIQDLMERDPIDPSCSHLSNFFLDKTVMVTGAAGSIGSELCRQLSLFKVKKLIMIDRAESDLFYLEHEFRRNGTSLDKLYFYICDVTHADKLENIFQKHQVNYVFHAAAYKHVPFMQNHPDEAIDNNVFGTVTVSNVASRNDVEKFILVSTDKAVNPSSVMGASKRLAELYCTSQNGKTKLQHMVVRFGNVLESNGSVLPLFKKQIAEGGPVTVTSKEVVRYFMTIPEAVHLVLQAGTFGSAGDVFILDMGEPVKIYDMAKQLIKLSGFELDKDIKIEIIGLRSGEKMYEDLWYKYEKPVSTSHPKIFKADCTNGHKLTDKNLKKLKQLANQSNKKDILSYIHEMIPCADIKID